MTWWSFHSTGWEFSEMSTTSSLFRVDTASGNLLRIFPHIFYEKKPFSSHPDRIRKNRLPPEKFLLYLFVPFKKSKKRYRQTWNLMSAMFRILTSTFINQVHVGVQADSLMKSEIISKSSLGFSRWCIVTIPKIKANGVTRRVIERILACGSMKFWVDKIILIMRQIGFLLSAMRRVKIKQ